MSFSLILAALATGQSADDPDRYYGFLWSLAGRCYVQESPRDQELRRICLYREGETLRMVDYRRHPRFDQQSDCTSRMRSDRLVNFACVGRGTGNSEPSGRFEGETLVFLRTYVQPPMQVRTLWRPTADGFEIEDQLLNSSGQWRPFGRPNYLIGWNYWRLTRVDAGIKEEDE